MSDFLYGFWIGWTWPIHLLSLRRYRKGERWSIENGDLGMPIEIREDWTRWNSIRWRWLLWFKGLWMRRIAS